MLSFLEFTFPKTRQEIEAKFMLASTDILVAPLVEKMGHKSLEVRSLATSELLKLLQEKGLQP